MADWENLRHLAALARGGSLSAAARMIGVEHATVARRIAALEAETGLKLVDRRGRRLSLTPEGERVAEAAARMETEALAVERLAGAAGSSLEATVTISAPPALAAAVLVEPLARLQREHPGLRLRLLGEHRRVSLERREAEIAVRLSRPEQGALTIVKLGEVRFRLCATPQYLEQTPPAFWRFIGYDAEMAAAPQQRRLRDFADDRELVFEASSSELQLAAARAGLGVAILPDFLLRSAPELALIEEPAPCSRELWLAVHSDLATAPAVRAVMDCLKQAAREGLAERQS